MKCPYCMSDIHRQAIVCSTCMRDLLFLTPILKRVDELESDLASFIAKVQEIKIEINHPKTKREAAISRLVQAAKLISLYLIQSIVLILLAKRSSIFADLFLFWAYSVVNLLYGIWSGFSMPNERRRYYLTIGLILGVGDLALRGSIYHWTLVEGVAFFVSDILWFWSGSVFGQRLRSWTRLGTTYSPQGFPLAALIAPRSNETAPQIGGQQDRLREAVQLLTPLAISIVSTLVSTLVKK